jgi:multidrug efflux pump subunit AcrA (membrane-fusion protein)
MTRRSRITSAAGLGFLLALAGCSGGQSQAPSASFAGGGDCKATKAEMSQLVNRGVEGEIEAQANGRQISSQAQARVDRYNTLLDSYLGGRCHV